MLSGCLLLGSTIVLFGCGFRLDMQVQPKVKPLRQSDFFEDGRASRPLIPGTVARGDAREDSYYYTGMVAANKPGDELPFPATREVLERGEQRFNIYCSPCHSRVGDGNGMIVQRGYRRPPSFHDPKLLNAPLGHFVDVMSNGFGAMPDYAAQVTPTDRWNIAAYIRALQLSQRSTRASVPAGQQIPAVTNPISGTPGSGATQPAGEQGIERKQP